MSTANFECTAQWTASAFNGSDEQTMAPLHPKVIRGRELKPFIRHRHRLRWRENFNVAH
jgi:hypothetical protein